MLLKEETKAIQSQLANYCRSGKLIEIKGARIDRLPNYRRLVYNVVYGILEKAYPITTSIISTPEFKSIVNAYFTEHDSKTPQVWKLPGEFYRFFTTWNNELKSTYPFLQDLMFMEWVEILVFNRENRELPEITPISDPENDVLAINPDREILKLDFPVFRGKWGNLSDEKGDYRLLVFRNVETCKVHFIEMSAIHEVLITGLENGASFDSVCDLIFGQMNIDATGPFREKFLEFLRQLLEEGFVLGSRV